MTDEKAGSLVMATTAGMVVFVTQLVGTTPVPEDINIIQHFIRCAGCGIGLWMSLLAVITAVTSKEQP
jgi:hypothetical protein